MEKEDVKQCRFLWILPVITFCFVPGCFIITYFIAVYKDHLHPFLPMISETGEELPENFVFAIIVNLGSFFGALNYVARYYVLEHWVTVCSKKQRYLHLFHNLNKSSMFLGFTAAAGALIVANVEANKWHLLHNFGAVTVILMNISYNWIHTMLTYMAPIIHLHQLKHIRLALSVLCTITLASGMSVMSMAYDVPEVPKEIKALVENGTEVQAVRFMGYRWVSTEHRFWWALFYYHLTEWLIVFFGGLFLLSFAPEFYNVHVEVPSVELKPRVKSPSKNKLKLNLTPITPEVGLIANGIESNGIESALLKDETDEFELTQITHTPPLSPKHLGKDISIA